MKNSCLNGLSALKSKFTLISKKGVLGITTSEFEHAFSRIFGEKVDTFTRKFSQNIDILETQLTKETLHESNFQTAFKVLKTPFEKFFTSVLIQSSSLDGTYSRKDFKAYTRMEPQAFKERILANFDFIQKYMIESILHNKEIEQQMNLIKLQIQECKVQEVKASDASSRDKGSNIRPSYDIEPMAEVPYNAEYSVFAVETQHSKQLENMNDTSLMEKVDSNTAPASSDMCENDNQADQNAKACDEERVAPANLIANLKLDIDENKKIQIELKKANASLTQELKECKSTRGD
ncbi:hypothetical protein Tco_1405260 [Tanacetum coccineum]